MQCCNTCLPPSTAIMHETSRFTGWPVLCPTCLVYAHQQLITWRSTQPACNVGGPRQQLPHITLIYAWFTLLKCLCDHRLSRMPVCACASACAHACCVCQPRPVAPPPACLPGCAAGLQCVNGPSGAVCACPNAPVMAQCNNTCVVSRVLHQALPNELGISVWHHANIPEDHS